MFIFGLGLVMLALTPIAFFLAGMQEQIQIQAEQAAKAG